MKKESKPKVKITIKGSTSGGRNASTGKSIKPGAMNQSTKIVKDKPAKKASTSYSPEYMSNRAQSDINDRAMKKQLSKYGMSKTEYGYKLNVGKPKRKPKAGSAVVSKVAKTGAKVAGKVAGRAKTTAREARDVVTAVGSAAQAIRKSPQPGMPVTGAIKNVAKQVKEVGKAAAKGKKGTTAYKITPNEVSQKNRKERGNKGYVWYDIKDPKKRK